MSGRSADAIIEIARDKNADLVVLGSHGRTGLERLLMGSVAERVIVLASCAVLVVKGK
jgi:nucleotide-binding universal stress UspA family protein